MKLPFQIDLTGKVVVFDKKNYKVGQFVKVRINRASSATLFGETVD